MPPAYPFPILRVQRALRRATYRQRPARSRRGECSAPAPTDFPPPPLSPPAIDYHESGLLSREVGLPPERAEVSPIAPTSYSRDAVMKAAVYYETGPPSVFR